jgi:hypothetical protein
MSLLPFAIVWGVLVLAIIALTFYRNVLARLTDDVPHVASVTSAAAESRQAALAKKLDSLERWGKILTVVALVMGVVLAVLYGYNEWIRSSRVSG